jgi:hypothetical protein
MNLLLKILLMRRSRSLQGVQSRDRGFAIPIVIALGLIMVVLGIASIYKSSDQNISATTQRGTSKALAAAEAGVAYYMAFLNRNSAIASFSYTNWTDASFTAAGVNTCDTFANIENWKDDWRSAGTDGSYQLLNYRYLSVGGVVPPAGTIPNNDTYGELTVVGTGSFSGNSFASTTVKVQLPIRPEMIGSSYSTASYALNPVVWLGSDTGNTFGDLTVSYPSAGSSYGGNIVVSKPNTLANPCDIGTIVALDKLQDPTKQFIVADPRSLPTTPNLPTSYMSISGTSFTGTIPNRFVDLGLKDANNMTVSRARQTINGQDYYHFVVQGDLNLSSFSVADDARVILYVQGNIIANNSTNVTYNNPSPYLEIYGNDQATRKYGGTGYTQFISFQNTNPITNLKAFIHAPDATVSYTGTGNVTYTGSIWARNWYATGPGITVTPDLFVAPDTFSYQTAQGYTTSASPFVRGKPKIFPPIRWETEEVKEVN